MIYKKLLNLSDQLESMISDGVQLVHGGNIFDWNETVIIELLEDINKQREFIESQSINSGDILINSITQEEVTVIKTDKINVYIEPIRTPIKYSKNEIWKHYKLKERA
ncbi:MAG: hypothetical protein D3916_10645 [Candidatus Electrothrix sp. MAN1_4]|nr:hypothetical protein [Candidatus Electrothrix sp. MAN1_4]